MIERLYLRLLTLLIGRRPLVANVSVILPARVMELNQPVIVIGCSSIRGESVNSSDG